MESANVTSSLAVLLGAIVLAKGLRRLPGADSANAKEQKK